MRPCMGHYPILLIACFICPDKAYCKILSRMELADVAAAITLAAVVEKTFRELCEDKESEAETGIKEEVS